MKYLSEFLEIDYPVIQGGMGNVSHSALTVAVSEAGGLGTLGAGTMEVPHVAEMIRDIQQRTTRPFAVNVPLSVHPDVKEVLELIVSMNVPVVTLSAGNPAPYIPKLKENGCKVLCVVSNPKQAKKAEGAGADAVIAEGYEAAGINSSEELTTFTLIPSICRSVTIPVIAAGGVGDGKGFLAALALGAEGVQMGTRFIATKDANVHDVYKHSLVEASSQPTLIIGRPYQKIRRVLKTPYSEQLLNNETQLTGEEFNDFTSEARHVDSAINGHIDQGHLNAGQITSTIEDIPTVKELITRMMKEAEEIKKNKLVW